jgi:serine/threonine protein kinase
VAFAPGVRFGPYEILSALGAGGMGEVYKARDTRLDRIVALKTSDTRFSERFQREARAIAALNHPHICSLYDVGPDYLVMECVEGQPLHGPVPIPQAFKLASQILDALAAAHEAGIIHRDLKPANILVGPHGVKLLDFGIAKIADGASRSDFPTAPTTAALTAEGSTVGTLAYMAPEQIEGQAADARSDLFAFGIVLYELIAGRRPFTGTSHASLIASILKEDPRPLHDVQLLTPHALARVVQTCLEKDPAKRWQSARDIQLALALTSEDAMPVPGTEKSLRLWQGLAGVAGMSALVALVLAGRGLWPTAAEPVTRLDASLPEGVASFDWVSVSPDGRKLVFNEAAQGSLWIRDLDSGSWRRLPDTNGAAGPLWSTDSRSLSFGIGNQLKKIDLAGGPSVTLATLPSLVYGSGTWNRDGVIVLGSWGGGSGGPLWKIPQTGGAPAAITQVDAARGELFHTWPVFLEDGIHFLYFRSGPPDVEGEYVGSLEASAADQSRRRILPSHFPASYANGYLFFPRPPALMAQRFEARQLQLNGAEVQVADAIDVTWYATGVFSVSPSGALAYRAPSLGGSMQLTWIDRHGKTVGTVGPPGTMYSPTVSPDGTRAVVNDGGPFGQTDLWVLDLSNGRRTTRLTFARDVAGPGVWSPDGTRIAYSAGTHGDTLYEKAASGVGEARELFREPNVRHWPSDWSRDSRFLLYWTWDAPKTGADVWVLPLQGNRKPVLLLGEPFNEWAAAFSPDMRWIAYSDLRYGRSELWLRPFRVSESGVPSLGEGRWQITKDGGNIARWGSDKEIIFNDLPWGNGEYSVSVTTNGDVPEFGGPERLFTGPGLQSASWNLAPDGQRFLVAVPQVKRTVQAPITVVLNWPGLLKK